MLQCQILMSMGRQCKALDPAHYRNPTAVGGVKSENGFSKQGQIKIFYKEDS